MAVELAKVSLWINAMVKEQPLSYLDHHIKCGNFLVCATPDLVAGGVPDGAFKPVTGDDKTVAKHFRALNKMQRKNLGATLDGWGSERSSYAEEFARLSAMEEATPEDVSEKRELYQKLLEDENLRRGKLEADAW